MDFGGFLLFGLLTLGLLAGELLLILLFIARSSRRWLALEMWLVGLAILALSGRYLYQVYWLDERLFIAAAVGDKARVEALLAAGARPGATWEDGTSALEAARRPQGRRDDPGKGQGGIVTAPGESRQGAIARLHSGCDIGFQASGR